MSTNGGETDEFQGRAVQTVRDIQAAICGEIEALEASVGSNAGSTAQFGRDAWTREEGDDGRLGGGGLTRVLVDGEVIEKGGVNVSEVHGSFSPEFAEKVPGSGREFFATGVSLVLHPSSPHVPTCHANFRHIVHGDKAWFGGGADLTPYYYEPEDREHFHGVWKEVCDAHPGVADYEAFAKWCDRYFYLPHRGERRGVGGIFFDYLWVDASQPERREQVLAFVRDAGHAFTRAFIPIVRRRMNEPVTDEQRRWHALRRGRYVEFNLIHDRGTVFGLKTGGRTESILMSLPPNANWAYAHEPAPNSPEAALLEQLRQPPPPADPAESSK